MRPASAASTRARPTVLIVLAAIFLVARVASGIGEALHPPRTGGLVQWRALDGADAAAAADHKPILYDFSAGWCEPCREMERGVFADAEDATFINASYVAVRVTDDNPSAAAAALIGQHEIEALPTLLVVYGPGIEPRRLVGYPGRRTTVQFLKHAMKPRPIPKADEEDSATPAANESGRPGAAGRPGPSAVDGGLARPNK